MIHFTDQDSFAIFQKPEEKKIYICIGSWEEISDSDNFSTDTFVVNAFDDKTYKLNGSISLLEQKIKISSSRKADSITTEKEQYIKGIIETINSCKNNKIKKCIISRVISEEHQIKNYYSFFENIINSYKNGFKYILNHPKFGIWTGVSPETLISGDKSEGFYSQALAGSKSLKSNKKWTIKEKEEHKYVVDFIRKVIIKNGDLLKESNNNEKIAGQIIHLNKDFYFKINGKLYPFIKQLHPTPAIAGIPVKKSLNFIKNIETHSRELYCGFIGIMTNKNCELFVNLRCAKITKNLFQLYVGGGITEKSNAEEEYLETQIKSQTLLSVIKKM